MIQSKWGGGGGGEGDPFKTSNTYFERGGSTILKEEGVRILSFY